jgi:carbon monoxide dehydrogenase subunit G
MAVEMTDEVQLPASCATVWQGINDADTLKACIPGYEELTKFSDSEMIAVATTKIGSVRQSPAAAPAGRHRQTASRYSDRSSGAGR